MFVVLKTVTPDKRIIKRRKQIRTIEKTPAAVCKTDKGLPFYILEVTNGKKGFDWVSAAKKCGKFASRIVAPHSLPLPDDSGLKRFIPISFNSILVFNTALKNIGDSNLPADKICITVTDRNAVSPSKICKLLPYSSTVRVITAHPERFAYAAAKAYSDYGASLVIRTAYEPVKQAEIIVSCDGAVLSSMNEAAIFVFKRKHGGKIRFCGSGVKLSDYHESLVPSDIESVDFAGALTELCGSSEYKSSVFSEIEISCQKCQDYSVQKCLRCYAIKKCNKVET